MTVFGSLALVLLFLSVTGVGVREIDCPVLLSFLARDLLFLEPVFPVLFAFDVDLDVDFEDGRLEPLSNGRDIRSEPGGKLFGVVCNVSPESV